MDDESLLLYSVQWLGSFVLLLCNAHCQKVVCTDEVLLGYVKS